MVQNVPRTKIDHKRVAAKVISWGVYYHHFHDSQTTPNDE